MPVLLEIILINLCMILGIVVRAMYVSSKKDEERIKQLRSENNWLRNQLAELSGEKGQGKTKAYSERDFLDADDPMEAILNEVGRVRPGN